MESIDITRAVTVPDELRIARCRKAPEEGPRVLLFSGGTGARDLSRRLVELTHNSIHLITPFDSGGSSAVLRKAFGMPAVGDLRNRLLALADRSLHGYPEITGLFSSRLPRESSPEELSRRLRALIAGEESTIASIDGPMQRLIRNHLVFFEQRMPEDFDLRGANIGNLILTGGYLNHARLLDPVLFLFSKLVEARGTVRPIADASLHLGAELEDDTILVGQHLLSGKEAPPISSPIRRIFLNRRESELDPIEIQAEDKICRLIREADLICYPMGSFYSSVLCNFLPRGIGDAVAGKRVPKVYIPNAGHDPEQIGTRLGDWVRKLIQQLGESCTEPARTADLLHVVLLDSSAQGWDPRDLASVEDLGVRVLDLPLITEESTPFFDDRLLAEALISLS